MSNPLKDSIMVQADITQEELDLLDYLVEVAIQAMTDQDMPGLIEDGIVLWEYDTVEQLWGKLEAAQGRMEDKLAANGIITDAFAERVDELIDLDEDIRRTERNIR